MCKKRKRFPLILMAAVLVLSSGCSQTGEGNGNYTIYYKDISGTSLFESAYTPAAQTFDDLVEELIGEFSSSPSDAASVSALPSDVQIQGYERGIDFLQIDFSESYYEMGNIEEVLLRAAAVETFTQIPGVSKILITVNSKQLVDADGQPVAAMDADSFIDTKNGGISSYQYAALVLYFPTEDGEKLQKEVRNVDYSSNMVLERVIVEQLIAGPSDPACRSAVNPSAEIIDISTRNGICTINFSEEFNEVPPENVPTAKAALYAIVDSICATSDSISGVKFSVEGQSNLLFWDEIELGSEFEMNEEIVETEAPVEEMAAGADVTLAGAEQ